MSNHQDFWRNLPRNVSDRPSRSRIIAPVLVALAIAAGFGMTQAIAAMQPAAQSASEGTCGYGCPTTTTTTPVLGTTMVPTTTTTTTTTTPATTTPATTTTAPSTLAETGADGATLAGLTAAGIVFLDLGYLTISATWPGRRRAD